MRPAFLLTLVLYAFSVLDLHEWAHVPATVVHWLEHHTDLGHHDEETGHHHDEHGDHDPFSEDCHGEFCACSGLVALSPVNRSLLISLQPLTTKVGAQFLNVAPSGFTGNVWIPPKA
jgi:hypothetical protein